MKNEHPIGLSTILGIAPAIIAGIVFVVLLVMNGGDVDAATKLTIAIVGGLSLVGTAGLRQWRSVAGAQAQAPATTAPPLADEGDAGSAIPEG